MSGVEFIAVAAAASSIIAIADGITKVSQAMADAQGLPQVFRQAESKLAIVSDILYATKIAFENHNVSGVEITVQKTVANCQNSWEKLNEIFGKVIPDDGASSWVRYRKAVKTLGKGNKVENLMKDLMQNVNLLATLKIMTEGGCQEVIETNPRKEKFEAQIAEVEKWGPSLPDSIFDEGEKYSLHVSGTNNTFVQGENAQQFNLKDHAQSIGSIHGGYHHYASKPTANVP
ncbi:hypothetical protein TWF481_008279 [Arthrobotrys musiformis]|uniref:NACHT-NTPase and P-loop NTPases N-terminal domain-containing protein n=1 Tax=Arthrobotrys musiformis TaxID=47236 RepID=A0AAV9W6M1_9PEZI